MSFTRASATKRLVTDEVLQAAKNVAESFLQSDPGLKKEWLEFCCEGPNLIVLSTDHDWVLCFFMWHVGRSQHVPREKTLELSPRGPRLVSSTDAPR